MDFLFSIDRAVFEFLNSFVGKFGWLDTVFVAFAEATIFVLGFGALFFLISSEKRKKTFEMLMVAYGGAFFGRLVITSLIRFFFFRERPFLVFENVNQLIFKNPSEGSFPSGHAVFMFVLSFAIFQYDKRWGVAFLILSFISALSRVIAGIHFPFDIFGGIVVGFISFFIADQLRAKIASRYENK